MVSILGFFSLVFGASAFTAQAQVSKAGLREVTTKDMVERSQMPLQTQGDCTSTASNKTSTGMTFKFTCASPPSSGEWQYTFMGDNAYTMKMKSNTPQQGKAVITTMDSSGKWLGADCGNIKPMVIPK